jgi:diguanylate cyclase (GGDEF)-like protein/PAS domain S-box-containing protein
MQNVNVHGPSVEETVSAVPPVRRLVTIGVLLAVVSVAVAVLDSASFKACGVSLIWLSSGVLIGVLLSSPRKQWPAYLVLGYVIDVSLNLGLSNTPATAATLSACNMVEVIVASSFMYPDIAPAPDLTRVRQLRSLLLYGVFLAPVIASLLGTLYLHYAFGSPFLSSFRSWFAADVLGIATVTPLYLSIHHGKRFFYRSTPEVVALFVILALVTAGVFWLTTLPMLWLVLMALLLLGMRLGFTASALGLLLVTFVGGYLSVYGHGPLSLQGSLAGRVLVFQSFIALSMLALYLTEVARCSRRRAVRRLEASESRFRSLTEASRDVILFAELNGSLQYISPAVTELLGWAQQDLVGENYNRLTHPEDAAKMESMLQQLLTGADVSPISYRAIGRNGGTLWLEASSRMLRAGPTGKPTGIVSVLRDISDRKETERQMQQAFQTVEQQAMMDGLTGVPNRRLLDQTLHREWLSCMREQTPLSLLLLDIDHFKLYNDHYGHLVGDECLRRIAREIQGTLRRSRDFLARYGGEEFVVLLPNTTAKNALVIAEIVRKSVEDCAIAHPESAHGLVTASLGCATIVPNAESNESHLLSAADAALYRAKSNGRNRLEAAESVMPIERYDS